MASHFITLSAESPFPLPVSGSGSFLDEGRSKFDVALRRESKRQGAESGGIR